MSTKIPEGALVRVYPVQPSPTELVRGYRTLRDTPSTSPRNGEWFDDFLYGTTPGTWNLNSGGAGATYSASGALVTTTEKAVGVGALVTGTTATGYASLRQSPSGILFGSCGAIELEIRLAIQALSTAGEEFAIVAGFHDNLANATDIDAVDGAYFRYHRTVDGDFWTAMTCNNATIAAGLATNNNTKNDILVAPTTAAQILSVAINSTGTEARFRIDGVQPSGGRITTNIPTTGQTQTGFGVRILKSAGVTSRAVYIDWVRLTWSGGDR